MSFASASMTSH